jgi:hypothetical protein
VSPDDAPVTLDVLRGTPTAEELAALLAVVTAAYAEESADAVAPDGATRSRWEMSARALRAPLRRENGWGGFAG